MSAMENATSNAGDLISKLTIVYNRSRQASITTELVDIITYGERLKCFVLKKNIFFSASHSGASAL